MAPEAKGEALRRHLERFKFAVRGRRGPNPPALATENDWWALGQHHGLATPLLDWTESPFCAVYFAFLDVGQDQTPQRAVYALARDVVEEISSKQVAAVDVPYSRNSVAFFRPLSDENARLVGQGGLFTRTPPGIDIEKWLETHVDAETNDIFLFKVLLPNEERELALRSLNRMNINHVSMFPDLHGSSHYCNLHLEISKY